MFQCYLDDSGTSGLPIVTLAGFVSTLEHWESLEPTVDRIMNEYRVPIFHAKQFHDTKPPFKTWTRVKKHSFAEEIFSATHGYIYGLSASLRRSDFEQAQKQEKLLPTMSSIGVCFAMLMTKIITDTQIGVAVKKEGLSFLIESGNPNNGGIEKFFHKMSKQPTFEGVLRSVTFISKESCRAIQLADFFAFYSRRWMREHDRFTGKVALPACPFLTIMERHGPIWQRAGYGKPEKIDHLDNLPDINSLTALTEKPS